MRTRTLRAPEKTRKSFSFRFFGKRSNAEVKASFSSLTKAARFSALRRRIASPLPQKRRCLLTTLFLFFRGGAMRTRTLRAPEKTRKSFSFRFFGKRSNAEVKASFLSLTKATRFSALRRRITSPLLFLLIIPYKSKKIKLTTAVYSHATKKTSRRIFGAKFFCRYFCAASAP